MSNASENATIEAQRNVDAAMSFFRECILQPYQSKARRYQECGLWGTDTASRSDWIVFAALLTGDRPGGTSWLPELSRHHVRNHPFGSGPTYTIVQEAVEEDFDAFKARFHLSISYATDLSRVEVRRFTGSQWVDYVEEFGGIQFFAFSRFTDPEIDIRPAWLFEHAELVLVLDGGSITYLNSALTAD